jgi:hypothetical protein
MKSPSPRSFVLFAGAALALSGCTESRLHNSSDFGVAVRQNLALQTTNPDPHYVGTPPPGGADAPRVALAQDRYEKGKVIKPENLQTSQLSTGGSNGSGSGGE